MNSRSPCRPGNSRSGASLVEVLIAALILALLAVAGGMYLAQGRGGIAKERNRRTALEYVNGRIEELRAAGYIKLLPLTDTTELIEINRSRNLRRTTRMWFVDLDGTGATTDAIRVQVSCEYLHARTNTVMMETLITK